MKLADIDRLPRRPHVHPEPSLSTLARALGRQYRRVRTTADRISADIRL